MPGRFFKFIIMGVSSKFGPVCFAKPESAFWKASYYFKSQITIKLPFLPLSDLGEINAKC